MKFKLSQFQLPSEYDDDSASVVSTSENEKFNMPSAIAYNIKSEPYFKNYTSDIQRVIGTTGEWNSPEFAEAVYNWQNGHGFSGKYVDGKLGHETMNRIAQTDMTLTKKYDPYASFKAKYGDDKPHQRVINLYSEVERIRNLMNATNIPINMLMGWIQVESGGKIDDDITAPGGPGREAGLFQISEEEAKQLGIDQDRLLVDKDYAITKGITDALWHARSIDQLLSKYPNMQKVFQKDSDMYWRLAFFRFSAGPGTTEKLINHMENSRAQISDWNDVMKFAASNSAGYKHSPIKWAYHTYRAFNLGNRIVSAAKPVLPPNVAKINTRIKNAKIKARQLIMMKLFSQS